jgi:hypothetical protein
LDIPELITRVRSRVASGDLPDNCVERRIFAGNGDGGTCACCGLQVTDKQVQYDVECVNGAAETRLFPMHLQCFNLWMEVSNSSAG